MTLSKSSFFRGAKGLDPTYEALRAPDNVNSALAREHFDALWQEARPYLADEIRANGRTQFQQVYWEVYLAATLLRQGVQLVSRKQRTQKSAGPDLLQRDPDASHEAIAITAGTGLDRVTEAPVGEAREVPDAEITLRITAGLAEKVRKYNGYRRSGLLPIDLPYVIAVNAGSVPSASKETELPRIVRAVLPFGWEVVQLDATTGRIAGRSYQHRPSLEKRSGALVSTQFFETTEAVGVSAVLYACVDPFNWPERGSGFVMVHNPRAKNPLPRGLVSGAREFWVDGDALKSNISERLATAIPSRAPRQDPPPEEQPGGKG